MITLKEKQFQVREATIIEAMHHLLIQKGYAATSMDDVAAEVGISKATLYLHFKSKKELVLKVITRQIEDVGAELRLPDTTLPPIERLRKALDQGIRRRVSIGSTQIDELPQEIHRDPDFQAAERRAGESMHALFREMQQEGVVRADIALGLNQEFIHAIFSMDFERLIKEGASVDELVAQLVDMVMRAIRP